MKPLNLYSKVCSFILLMFLVLSCTNDEPVTIDQFENELSNKVVMDKLTYPIELTGHVHFPSYAVKEHRVIAPGETYKLPCDATLDKNVTDQNYSLLATAVGPTETYFINFDVKITPSGIVSFIWPETYEVYVYALDKWFTIDVEITNTISEHEGSIIHGPGVNKGTVNFKGKFDGIKFYATSHLIAKQEEYGTNYFYKPPYLEDVIDGPIKVGFSIFDLDVVPN